MNEWIDCKNDLPDYDVPVLWYTEDGNYWVEALDKDGNPWLWSNNYDGFPTAQVTHWQNLPEPPKPPQLIETHTQAEINSWDVGVN